ncbi:MAG: EF-P lysine aminoacylase EpmA [Desulfobacterales bacterium]
MLEDFRQTRIMPNLVLRSKIIRAVRRFFLARDYIEVETPVRIPAPAPETHIDAVSSGTWFLQTSPELCMKRLLAAGFPRMFQICRCFRDNERGKRHLPEFTLLEWYCAHTDYRDMMVECEALIRQVACCIGSADVLHFRGNAIRLKAPWQRVTVKEAFDRYAGGSLDSALESGRFDEVMALEIEPNLGKDGPVFLLDYPARKGALARLKPDDPRYAERFELYIGGLELCNAFSELTDPEEQRLRFLKETQTRVENGKKPYPVPKNFLAAMPKMPAASGNALGVDRLVMLFCNASEIDEVTAFVPEEL